MSGMVKKSKKIKMQREYTHFVVTRFNLRMKTWLATDEDADKWLPNRIKIFEQFTLPSMLAQSSKNFVWFLLFDPSIKEKDCYRNFLNKLEGIDFIQPLYIDASKKGIIPSLREEIAKHVSECTCQIITTRLDNDDAVDQDFIRVIQDNVIGNKSYILNFDDGLGYSEDFVSFIKCNQVNPFASFIECVNDVNDLQTVYCCNHPKLKDIADVVHLKGQYMFFVNYHDQNVSNNQFLTIVPDIPTHYLKRFLCFKFPNINRFVKYRVSRPIAKNRVDLGRFNVTQI